MASALPIRTPLNSGDIVVPIGDVCNDSNVLIIRY